MGGARADTGACLRCPRQGQLHPLKYLRGLAKAVERYSGKIYCSTHAQELQDDPPALVRTRQGPAIRANAVVIATKAPIFETYGLYTAAVGYRTYAIVCIRMYLLMAGLSAASCFFIPAQTAALPLIVPENELLVANSINVQTLQLNQIFAPAVVGFAVAWLSEKNCFYLDAASFIISALLVSTIRIDRTAVRDVSASTTIWANLKAGLKFITGHPVARILILTIAIANDAVAIFEALFAVYVRDLMRGGSRIFGSARVSPIAALRHE